MSSRRRPFDDVKYLVAAILGIPLLLGLVYALLYFVYLAWTATNVVGATITFVVGVAILIYATYESVELLRGSTGR